MTINKLCKIYREKILQITLLEMSIKTGVKLSTISAFENGRSNNINHLEMYFKCSESVIDIETLLYNIKTLYTKGL